VEAEKMSSNTSETLYQVNPTELDATVEQTKQGKKKGEGHAKRVRNLIKLTKACGELFHQTGNSDTAETFITLNTEDKRITLPLDSIAFDQWLINAYRKAGKGAIAGDTARKQTTVALMAEARHDCPAFPVFTRTASIRDENKDAIALYYDLANDKGEVVEITADGWSVISDSPVKFVRRQNCTEQIRPTHDGADINLLRPFINIADEGEWKLFVGVLLSWFEHRDFGGYFGLLLNGTQDAAKSTTARMLKRIVDPSPEAAETPDLPEKTDDLWLMASQMWLLSFDNLSDVTKKQADHLCRISTGGGSIRRTLYANGEITTHNARRPIVMNGISELATRGDLANRCVQVSLPSLRNEDRKTEKVLWSEFYRVLPRILGGFFDALVCSLKNRAALNVRDLPRMGDGALLVTAAESALGWEPGTFVKLYNEYRQEEESGSLDSDPFGFAVSNHIKNKLKKIPTDDDAPKIVVTTAEQLQESLRTEPGSNYFPQTGRTTGDALRRLVPALKASGLVVIPPGRKSTWHEGKKGRYWTFGLSDQV
jgi:hypothetical protein